MAVTQNTYTGNGSTTNYSFTFPYLETTDIKVSVNGVDTTAYTLANATTVSFNSAPANGAAIRIYRDTDDSGLAATFYPGSAIRSQDLNDNFTQNLYVTQEVNNYAVQDAGNVTLSAVYTFSNPVSGQTPTSNSHLATKQYVDSMAFSATGISDGNKGDITVSSSGTTWNITSGSIVNADISASAAISASKVEAGTTSNSGVLQLTDSTASTSITTAATPASVKVAYDLANAAIPKSLVDAKGDILVATADDTLTRLAVGTNNQILIADSTQAAGIKWGSPPTSPGYEYISSISLDGVSVGAFTSGITSTYNTYRLVFHYKRSSFSNNNNLDLQFSFDGGSTWSSSSIVKRSAERISFAGTTTPTSVTYTVQNGASVVQLSYSGSADDYIYGTVDLYNLSAADLKGVYGSVITHTNTPVGTTSDAAIYTYRTTAAIDTTSAINAIRLSLPDNGGTNSRAYLYGARI